MRLTQHARPTHRICRSRSRFAIWRGLSFARQGSPKPSFSPPGRPNEFSPPCSIVTPSTPGVFGNLLFNDGVTATDPEAFVLLFPEGVRLHYSNWRRGVWVPAGEASGLPDLNFHDSKTHPAGTALLEEGVNVKTAQERLGHASPRTTLAIYAQATKEADREAANRLGERFRPRDGRGMVRQSRKSRSTPHPL